MSAATGLARVVRTPSPPYYAVTTTTELAPGFVRTAYFDLGTQLYADAHRIEGFLGLEAFFEGGAAIACPRIAKVERDYGFHLEPAQKDPGAP